MRPLPAVPGQMGVFTAGQALSVGWTRPSLTRARQRGDIVRLRHGHYCHAAGLDFSVEGRRRVAVAAAAAVVLAVDNAVASHRSAAVLAELPVLSLPRRPCLTMPAGTTGTTAGAHLHRAHLPPELVMHRGAVARTDAARTIVDIARESGVEEALVVADAALRRGLVTQERLAVEIAAHRGVPGIATARALSALADGRSESPLETVSRLRLERAGVAAADLQTTLTDLRGAFLARTDFYWDEYGVVGEADGLAKYGMFASVVEEKLRQERLENCGLIVVRWGWSALTDMDQLAGRLRAAFDRGRHRSSLRQWHVDGRRHGVVAA